MRIRVCVRTTTPRHAHSHKKCRVISARNVHSLRWRHVSIINHEMFCARAWMDGVGVSLRASCAYAHVRPGGRRGLEAAAITPVIARTQLCVSVLFVHTVGQTLARFGLRCGVNCNNSESWHTPIAGANVGMTSLIKPACTLTHYDTHTHTRTLSLNRPVTRAGRT